MEKRALPKDVVDFSRPWDFSDVVLMVEGKRFHVHRSILAMWSPVFSRMFTADFKEKTAQVVPLPEKKSSEINEMLLVIYPTSAKPIDGESYFFLLNLAKQYMMEKLTGKCEEFLISCLRWPNQSPLLCLELLDIAQDYGLERLGTECIDKAQSIGFRELKNHPIYSKINFPNFRKIVEGRIQRIEEEMSSTGSKMAELLKKSKDVESHASKALNEFDKILSFLVKVIRSRSDDPYPDYNGCTDTQEKLDVIGDIRKSPYRPLQMPLSNLRVDLLAIQQYSESSL
ncbi:BTB and MATH domain-containing protein 36-like [Oculina patagonica]